MAAHPDSMSVETSIDALPTPLAIAIADYRKQYIGRAGEKLHLLKLWHACEAVELLVRLLVVICVEELYARKALTEDLADSLRDRIDRPTLGLWKSMLLSLIDALSSGGSVLAELVELAGDIAKFFDGEKAARAADGPDMLTSFSAMRNRLAHGGGLTDGAAAMLLDAWQDRIDTFLQRFVWLHELSFYARSPDGELLLLRGSAPQRVRDTAPSTPNPNEDEVVVTRGGHSIVVWPLIRYGIPWISNRNFLREDTVVEMYARRSSVDGFHYTPIGLSVANWSSSRANATARFFEMFPPSAAAGSSLSTRDAVESFRRDISKDAKLFVGRQDALEKVLDLVRAPPPQPVSMLWLSGHPGIGKSTLVAKVAHRLIAEAKDLSGAKIRIVPYRFRRGDARCSREYFFMLASRSITRASRIADPADYKIEALQRSLGLLASDIKCIFVLDGMDEIDELDPSFLSDVCVKLAKEFTARGNVTWLLAGRDRSANSSLAHVLREAGAHDIFPGGLAKMRDSDIRAILLDQIGSARNTLIQHDETRRTELFALSASIDLTEQLDAGSLPSELLVRLAEKGHVLSRAVRCYPIRGHGKGKKKGNARKTDSWLINDKGGELYCIEHGIGTLPVFVDTMNSNFVSAVTDKSEGLPLYVRYVVLDILAGRLERLDGRDALPDGLNAYYQQLLKQQDIGTKESLLTPILCLIAVAREPLSKEQLLVRLKDHLPESADHDAWFETVILHLSSMLRGGPNGRSGSGYGIYHQSLREHLEQDAATKDSMQLAKEWLEARAIVCVTASPEEVGPFASYLARHGVTHLLEANKVADAIKLLDHLKNRPAFQKYVPRGYLGSVTSRKVGLALQNWLDEWKSGTLSHKERDARDAEVRAMSPVALANIIFDTYETGVYSAVLRILIEFNYDEWWRPNKDGIRNRFVTPYDIVAKHTVGEALSDVYQSANEVRQNQLLKEVEAMTSSGNIDERETAGYALQEIYINNPDLINDVVISRWADSDTNIERMILGELLVSFAHAGHTWIASRIHSDRFWKPVWENNALDIDDFRVLTHAVSTGDDARFAACVQEHEATRALLDSLRADPYVRGSGDGKEESPLLALLNAYDELSAGDPLVRNALPALKNALAQTPETRRVAKNIIKVLFSHSLWAVAEAATSVVADLAQEDMTHLGLIDELLAEPDAYWRVRYGTVDAAFNVRELDDYRRLRHALQDNFNHLNSRVRGICFDELFAWVRLAEVAQRDGILKEFEAEFRHAIEYASDCWELEYIYLLFSFLWREGFDVGLWLGPDQRYAAYFGEHENSPFYELDREGFLLRIDRICRAEQ